MCTDAQYEQEVVGDDFADVFKHVSLGGTHYIHHVLVVAPFLTFPQDLFKQTFALCVGGQLEVMRAFVTGQSQKDDPFVLIPKNGVTLSSPI